MQCFAPDFLYTQHRGSLLLRVPGCLKAVSLIITKNNEENWEHQMLPRSVLREEMTSWFKHQPKLDRVRHMIFTAAHTVEHIKKADKAHPTARTVLALVQSLPGEECWGNLSAQVLTAARGFPLLLPALKEQRGWLQLFQNTFQSTDAHTMTLCLPCNTIPLPLPSYQAFKTSTLTLHPREHQLLSSSTAAVTKLKTVLQFQRWRPSLC